MTSKNVARRAARIQIATAREIAAVQRNGARGAHNIQAQVNKEIAAITAVSNVAAAADALPDDFPDLPRRMADRIAIGTSRFIGRLL